MPDSGYERNSRLWKLSSLDSFIHSSRATTSNPRNVTPVDVSALGTLLFDAFRGEPDDIGQTEMQYASKATAIVDGRYGEWIQAASWTIEFAGGLRSACLVCDYEPYGCPVIAVVATMPSCKRLGDGAALVDAALKSLAALGHRECGAMITVGNAPSERLFGSRGFLPVAV